MMTILLCGGNIYSYTADVQSTFWTLLSWFKRESTNLELLIRQKLIIILFWGLYKDPPFKKVVITCLFGITKPILESRPLFVYITIILFMFDEAYYKESPVYMAVILPNEVFHAHVWYVHMCEMGKD